MRKKILIDCRYIQMNPHSGISKDTLTTIDILHNSSVVDVYLLTYKKYFLFNLVSKIKQKKIRVLLFAIYSLCVFYKLFIPSCRTPKAIKTTKDIPSELVTIVGNDRSKIVCIDVLFIIFIYNFISKWSKSLLPYFKIETYGVDYFFSSHPIPLLVVDPNTKKIIRCHDHFPIKFPDWFGMSSHYKLSLEESSKTKSIFISSCEPSKHDLITYYPELKEDVFVIPVIMNTYERVLNRNKCNEIIANRFSIHSIQAHSINRNSVYSSLIQSPRYILNIARMDAYKNHINLIRAWSAYQEETGDDIKLILVASIVNKAENYKLIDPYIANGSLIHLEKLRDEEISYLYSHAECFVFPSLAEGFGIPPVEAMQCGCPCIVSDIPEHNWVCGDAALKINPHSVKDIVSKMKLVLMDANKKFLRDELIEKGYERTKLYTKKAIAPQWETFFRSLQ